MYAAAITLTVQQITPYLQQYGPLFAAKAAESLGEKVPGAVGKLWQGIKAKFDTETVAKSALERMLADPKNEKVKTVVEYHLEEYLKDDPAFAERIRDLLKDAQAAVPAGISYQATATGGSAVAQGEGARAVAAGGTLIEGGVHPGRDFVSGDVTYHHYQEIHTENIQSPADFAAALLALQTQIAAIKQQPDLTSAQTRNIEVAEKKVTQAAIAAQKPAADGNEIKQTLTEAKETFELLSGSLASAVGLGTILGNLILLARQVFGG